VSLFGSLTLILVVLAVLFIFLLLHNTSMALRLAGGIFGGLFELVKLLVRGLAALTSGIFRMIRRR